MTKKELWIPEQVNNFMNKNTVMTVPDYAYCTENFSWNEVMYASGKWYERPPLDILKNLKTVTEVLQLYRTAIGKPIIITSSWRTKKYQQYLLNEYNKNLAKYKKGEIKFQPNQPAQNSLHSEGLALDFSVQAVNQAEVQSLVNSTFVGEAEFGHTYTHIGLTLFSENYLRRKGIYNEAYYKKHIYDVTTLPAATRKLILKRLNPINYVSLPSTFSSTKNKQFFAPLET